MAAWTSIKETVGRWVRRVGAGEPCIELRAGDRIHLQPDREDDVLCYPGRIEEVQVGTLEIWVPAAAHLPQLRRGRPVRVLLDRDERTYFFDTHVLARDGDRDPFLTVDLPEEVQPLDDPRYFRVSAIIEPSRAALLDAAGQELRELAATVLDISGGGIQFVSPAELAQGDRVRVVLPLKEVGVIDTVVEVTGARKGPTPRGQYRLDARFSRLSEQQRDQIFRFLFQQQVELRKKGLL
ncbi:MAG TPA: PilZ domain-containing protein [Dehalococcoidia bacterium]